MKANNFFLHLLLAILIFNASSTGAQTPKPCGPYKINRVALQKALDFEETHHGQVPATNQVIRVYFHIVSCNNGTLQATTADIVNGEEFSTLVADYASDNICFINASLNYVYDSKLDTGFTAGEDDESLFDPYTIEGCVNIFYVTKINGANGNCNCGIGGLTFDSPGTRCLVASSNVDAGHTISHEVGHCFGLLHTFDPSNGYEDIDGSNSSTSADLIMDTPADPFAYDEQTCFSNSGCLYTGSCTDPKGQTNFTPPYTNIMAYWWANGCNASVFTSDQYTRANSFLSSDIDLGLCESPTDVTEGPNVNISYGYVMWSAIDQFTTTGTVTISGTSQVTFGGATVLLEPGFDANLIPGGLFLVKTPVCSSDQPEGQPKQINATANSNDSNPFLIYPNPTEGTATLSFSADKPFSFQLQITDVTGRIMVFQPGVARAGDNQVEINLSSYRPGVYFIKMLKDSRNVFSLKLIKE